MAITIPVWALWLAGAAVVLLVLPLAAIGLQVVLMFRGGW